MEFCSGFAEEGGETQGDSEVVVVEREQSTPIESEERQEAAGLETEPEAGEDRTEQEAAGRDEIALGESKSAPQERPERARPEKPAPLDRFWSSLLLAPAGMEVTEEANRRWAAPQERCPAAQANRRKLQWQGLAFARCCCRVMAVYLTDTEADKREAERAKSVVIAVERVFQQPWISIRDSAIPAPLRVELSKAQGKRPITKPDQEDDFSDDDDVPF
ncbi:hypothetical protein V2J09_006026 [Rumex salicifolius]